MNKTFNAERKRMASYNLSAPTILPVGLALLLPLFKADQTLNYCTVIPICLHWETHGLDQIKIATE